MAASKKTTGQRVSSQLSKSINRRKNLSRSLVDVVKSAKSYKEYLELTPRQVSKLRTDELRTMIARMNKIEKKRLANLEKYGYNLVAERNIKDNEGVTRATRGMTRQELLHEYARAKSFFMSETSTVQGAKKFVQGVSQLVGETDRELTKDEINLLYSIYHKYQDKFHNEFYSKGDKNSYEYQQGVEKQKEIYQKMKEGKSEDEILVDLGVLSETEYRANQDTSTDYNWRGYHHP